MISAAHLRKLAISNSLFPPTSLAEAINRIGFVQADPIRSPARAQDLILRHRVDSYHAGDLERFYPSLDIEEDYFYAYGFVSNALWNLLHPREPGRLGKLEQRVLDAVRSAGRTHPRSLEAVLGRRRVTNAWGSRSKATTQALEWLHYRGLVRVVGRENGIRVYEAVSSRPDPLDSAHRLQEIIMTVARILAPVLEGTLRQVIARYWDLGQPRAVLAGLLDAGRLRAVSVDDRRYLYPDPAESESLDTRPRLVRFLAPFDPIVWDRKRFEHLWGWSYRFEAYTPAARRIRGYYALPLLWGDAVIGWANATVKAGKLHVEPGFVGSRPRDKVFARQLDAEIARLGEFLR